MPDPENERTEELIRRIKKLERKLNKIEMESKIGLEDQLFFGVVISLVLFFFSLPLNEVAQFFQAIIKLNLDLSIRTAESIKYSGFVFLALASGTRYYGAVSESRKYKLYSLQFLLGSWNIFLLIFIINVFSPLGIIGTAISCVILSFTYVLMVFLERKALNFYASKKIISKKDLIPSISIAFFSATIAIYIAFVIELLFVLGGFSSSLIRLLIVFLIVTVSLSKMFDYLSKHKKSKARTRIVGNEASS